MIILMTFSKVISNRKTEENGNAIDCLFLRSVHAAQCVCHVTHHCTGESSVCVLG